MEKKISISIGQLQREFGDKEALRIAKELGADAVDFDLISNSAAKETSVYSETDEEIIAHYKDIRKYAAEIGIEIGQTHGRINGFKRDEEFNKQVIIDGRLDCLATAALGAPVCVMHGPTTGNFLPDLDPEEMHKLAFRMFTGILPFAREQNIKIATETFGDSTGNGCIDFFGDIGELIKCYNRVCAVEDFAKYFTICVDTGHSNKASRFGQPSPGDVIRLCGQHISVLHLNDNDTLTDQHKMPKSGCIDWNDVFNALDEVGYNGIYNMELDLKFYGVELMTDTAGFALKVLKNLLEKR